MIAKPVKLNGHNRRNGHHTNGHTNRLTGMPLDSVADGAEAKPTPAAGGGRDAGGKFTKGNTHGRGNPFARKLAEMRSALLSAVGPEQVRELGAKLYARALANDNEAARLLLSYVVGKPQAVVDPDMLDLAEFAILERSPTLVRLLRLAIDCVSPDMATARAASTIASSAVEVDRRLDNLDVESIASEVMAARKAAATRI
jgi:hypothetical protein